MDPEELFRKIFGNAGFGGFNSHGSNEYESSFDGFAPSSEVILYLKKSRWLLCEGNHCVLNIFCAYIEKKKSLFGFPKSLFQFKHKSLKEKGAVTPEKILSLK